MSEETKIFRGDHAPEEGRVEPSVPAARKAPAAPVADVTPPAETPASKPAAEPVAAAPMLPPATAPAPEPALDFHLDESQLFHTPEAVRQRMAQLASIAHSTAHMLDEQAQEAERIAQRLKKL